MHAAIDFPGLSRWLSLHGGDVITSEFFHDNDNLTKAMSALNDLDRLVSGKSEKEIGCAINQLANIARSAQQRNATDTLQYWPADTD